MKRLLATFVIAAAVAGCGGSEKTAQTAKTQPASPAGNTPAATAAAPAQNAPAAVPSSAAAIAPAAATSSLSGIVQETFASGGYTYMRVKTPAGEEWVAVRQTEVKKGQKVDIAAQMTMEKFHSSSLNRTFDRIVFGDMAGAAPAAQQAAMGSMKMPPSMASGGGAMGGPKDHMNVAQAPANVKVAKAEGPDAKTVAEVWSAKAAVKDKTVVVRGTVVKSLTGIMGKNWLHIRDGSGSAAAGDNDLTVTTAETAKVGDVVVVRGVVRVDKDFGAGYVYPVIVEEAKIQ